MHSENVKYLVYVLWIKGHSLTTISHWTRLRVKQLAGIVERGPYKNRSDMTDEARQAALSELEQIRYDSSGKPLDGGVLDRIEWTILPLLKEQRRD